MGEYARLGCERDVWRDGQDINAVADDQVPNIVRWSRRSLWVEAAADEEHSNLPEADIGECELSAVDALLECSACETGETIRNVLIENGNMGITDDRHHPTMPLRRLAQ